MDAEVLDTKGLNCPQPVLKLAVKAPQIQPGQQLDILGDCPTFERDIRTWCERLGKTLLSVTDEGGGIKRIRILF